MFAYRADGAFRATDPTFVLGAGEVAFPDHPTDAELEVAFPGYGDAKVAREAAAARAAVAEDRRAAYVAEADPLFFKSWRGGASLDGWRAKVAEIKARFPAP